MSETDDLRNVADQLAEVIFTLEDVDLNALLDSEVRTVLDAKDDLGEVCLRARNDQHAGERRRSDTESEGEGCDPEEATTYYPGV